MKLRRIALWLILVFGGCVGIASAQTVTLTETSLKDATGAPFNGPVQFCPVLSNGIATWFHFAGGGLGINRCATVTASNGSFTATVPDTFITSIQNLCLAVHAWDPATNQDDLNIPCLQPSNTANSPAVTNGWCILGGACSLDNYSSAIPALPQVNLNLALSATFSGGNAFTGTLTAPLLEIGLGFAQVGVSSSDPNGADLTFNGDHTNAGRLGILGNHLFPILTFNVPTGGNFAFDMGGVPFGNGCANFVGGGNLQSTGISCAMFSGAWASNITYGFGTIVFAGGSTWISVINGNLGNNPTSTTGDWGLISGSGSTTTPNTSPTCSGTQALAFSTTGDISYNVTLSANCTLSISDAGAAGTLRHLTLIIHPAGFVSTLPASSGSIIWSGGTPPTVSTSATTVIIFASTGVAPILGGL